VNKKRY